MAERHDVDEDSKGGARSILTFAIVAAALTVMLIAVGLRGKPPEAPQPTTEAPATSAPATSGSQTP